MIVDASQPLLSSQSPVSLHFEKLIFYTGPYEMIAWSDTLDSPYLGSNGQVQKSILHEVLDMLRASFYALLLPSLLQEKVKDPGKTDYKFDTENYVVHGLVAE